jgi:hypothetical protein
MRYPKYLLLVAACSLLLPVSAFARSSNERTFTLPQAAEIGSTQLPAGKYKVEWDGTGSHVQATILQGKKTLVTSPATLETHDKAASQDAVVLKQAKNNMNTQIREIDFGSHKEALVFPTI